MLTLDQIQAAGGYQIIYADPCWSYGDGGRREVLPRYRGVENHYSVLSVQELALMPVERLAAENCALFLWGVWPLLSDMLTVGKAWGFRYKTLAFDWIKTRGKDVAGEPQPFVGLGRWTRSSSEGCFLFVKGSPQRVDKGVRQALETLTQESVKSPLLGHSEKPAEVRDRLVQLCGDVPRIELFARQRVEGWDCWGNEAPGGSDVEMRA